MNHSHAPAIIDELYTSQQQGNLSEHARVESAWARENCVWHAGNLKTKINHS